MTALTVATDRYVTGGVVKHLLSGNAAVPFEGSLLGYNSTGYAVPLTAGLPFAGISELTIISRDAATAAGSRTIRARTGNFRFDAVISGLTQTDIAGHRRVYASDDNALSLTAEAGNTFIGWIADLSNHLTNGVVIQAQTVDRQAFGNGEAGVRSVGDVATATLTVQDLDKVIYVPSSSAATITLPAMALSAGHSITLVKNTTLAVAITLAPAGTGLELVQAVTTYAATTGDAGLHSLTVRSDGTAWFITAKV